MIVLFFISQIVVSQVTFTISGTTQTPEEPLPFVNVYIEGTTKGTTTDINGNYTLKGVVPGKYALIASHTGFTSQRKIITLLDGDMQLDFTLTGNESLREIVISGTLKPINRLESPVPVEVYRPSFFRKNPTPNIFEALQNINGVRPQLNCNVCNTGDIHINGLEGPYTLVLIDGMPIVSGLSTVYGLSGIPNSLIEQVEIVKGPASSLYGSEAVGGLINVITKLPEHAPKFSADVNSTSWGEVNTDLSYKIAFKNATMLLGLNYFNYSNPVDKNKDNFTDMTLQDRISVFQKWDIKRKEDRKLSLAGRFFYEDRWGGEMQWNPSFRGGDEVYGESIYTTRWELLGNYQLPVEEKMFFQFSLTDHDQNSVYGDVKFLAQQRIGFGQFIWDKKINRHDLLFGTAFRYNYYNDNTLATAKPDEVVIPSLFVQDEITLSEKHKVLLGGRYDYDSRHGHIFTPRLAYRYKSEKEDLLRFNAGTGFRVVNIFTEEHAALTGARELIIAENLKPERSFNINFNYLKKVYQKTGKIITLDASVWYTHFTNVILPDYDTNPNQIIYNNLDGSASSKGLSIGLDAVIGSGFKAMVGATFQDVTTKEKGVLEHQILTERFMGTWALSYKFYKFNTWIDYTGNIYGSMRLPLLGESDPRPEYSPTWSIQNIQITYGGFENFEIYGGVKNLLNWTPTKSTPFLIARADDPFDQEVVFDGAGNAVATPNNPYALTFDPSYMYAPNQGIRGFMGIRFTLK
ncbi:MAG: TonB-dependent receptor [Flavobacteriaceae bacterium CG_4_8_14_3_um_filter_34_10]|nr:MAG: TonB-dependent receptor [Flavobacteriaceae bacterium CG_4_8_14_3_um_filter_34_10]PIZ08880.1 MAG: TonB-dependent receptor [Flavobacteriaceae bacterium CG_4_10_14_0_8_um_filter_34_31]PJC06281.1 MAG: TonB-dependent receptor [Flavobacteriaceae bacterium CG_4_9_14_0_8_um_filter_34_30]